MKRVLLVLWTFIFSASLFAQSFGKYGEIHSNSKIKNNRLETEEISNPVGIRPNDASIMRGGAATMVIGNSANPFTGVSVRSALTYDPDLDALVLIHRQDPAITGTGTSGWIRYALSTDKGVTWDTAQGPLWNNIAGTNARYPQGFLLNPLGNTDVNNAHVVFMGPTLEGTNGASWGGVGYASQLVSDTGAATNQVLFNSDLSGTGRFQYIPDGGTVANGKIWIIDAIPDWAGGGGAYTDSMALYVGEINGNNVDFTESRIYEPTASGNITSEVIAFSPDGQTGYISALGRVNSAMTPDEVYSMVYKKTTDGGSTWTSFAQVPFDTTQIKAELGLAPGDIVGTAFELDVAVDKNGNPHMFCNIGAAGTPFSIFGVSTGLYHVWSDDGGATWNYYLVSTTQDFRGYWGDATNSISEDNRPQISRDTSGNFILFAHFDVDTLLVYVSCAGGGGGNAPCGNIDRNIHYTGYNVDVDMHTPQKIEFGNTDAFQLSFEFISDISMSTATGVEIPFSYQIMAARNNYVSPTTHKYETGLGFTYLELFDSTIIGLQNSPSVEDLAIFPNPAKNIVNVSFSSKNSGKASIEVMNLLGQKLMAEEIRSINPGSNLIQVDLSPLSRGIYLVRIGANGKYFTRKLVVE
jgi:Secretion system C-terminal sorting domain